MLQYPYTLHWSVEVSRCISAVSQLPPPSCLSLGPLTSDCECVPSQLCAVAAAGAFFLINRAVVWQAVMYALVQAVPWKLEQCNMRCGESLPDAVFAECHHAKGLWPPQRALCSVSLTASTTPCY